MSEELKLLPCYKCGGIATHSYYEKYPEGLEPLIIDGKIIREGVVWHFVKCEKCREQRTSIHPKLSVEAIKEWNNLPRALAWTTEPPTIPGWYFVHRKGSGHGTHIAPIWYDSMTFVHDEKILQYAGPIPMPKEATP